MSAPTAQDRVAPLRAVLDDAMARFPELGYLGPNGVLSIPVDTGPVTRLRLELPGQFLHLQSIRLVTADGSDGSLGARVTASSWYGPYGEAFDPARLFDWDHPSGTVVHTQKDSPSWVEVQFAHPLALAEVHLRNVAYETSTRARALRVIVRTRWRSRVLFDGAERRRALRAAMTAHDLSTADPQVQALLPVLVDTFRGAYPAARAALDEAELDADLVKAFRGVVNAELLPSRELLWGIHGPTRTFRFWSPEEQSSYVEFAVEVVEALRERTPHVCFGFGAVLSVVRDQALIPHDDDLDIIIGFEQHEAATLADGLALVTRALTDRGFAVRGNFSAHRQVGRTAASKPVDVFVGLFEGDVISWYPGTRGALNRDMMYPTTTAPLLGAECPVPARPEAYLVALYGEGWHTPDPNFTHRWDRSSYADLAGKPAVKA